MLAAIGTEVTVGESLKSLIVIPARLKSTRLPGKMLLAETGKPLIEHTWDSASRSQKASHQIVATDDDGIFQAVQNFGGQVEMTLESHATGTDRVAEVALRHKEHEIIVNVQGDEPDIPGQAIDLAISILEDNPRAVMSTLATPIRNRASLNDPACVKVVVDSRGKALYFSRSPIPHPRAFEESLLQKSPPVFLQHVGLYAYRRDFLMKIADLPPCDTETTESLEQLRVLHAGYSIHVGLIDAPIIGIDTPEDYQQFVSSHSND